MISEEIKNILEAESDLALTFGTDLFIGREPIAPDLCVTIFDTGGAGTGSDLQGSNGAQESTIQIRVRANDYPTGYELADNIIQALHGRKHEVWNTTNFNYILSTDAPVLLDWDDNDRVRFVINFRMLTN